MKTGTRYNLTLNRRLWTQSLPYKKEFHIFEVGVTVPDLKLILVETFLLAEEGVNQFSILNTAAVQR